MKTPLPGVFVLKFLCMNWINKWLDQLTMFQVVIYGLYALAGWAVIGSVFGILSISVLEMALSLSALFGSVMLSHYAFSRTFKAPANQGSSVISALILFFVLQPSAEPSGILGLVLAGFIAVAGKYFLVWQRIHLFNPAALAAVIVGIPFLAAPTWWVGSRFMFVPVLLIGLLVVKKIRRFDLFWTVILVSSLTVSIYSAIRGIDIPPSLTRHFLSWPIIFFASFMVTEPLSTPPRKYQRIAYGAFIGIFSSIPLHVGSIYSTPELILVLANIYSFSVGLRGRLKLSLKKVTQVAKDVFEFQFKAPRSVSFIPGQYVEWALPHVNPDSRGIKRYLTISSSPTEDHVAMSVKIPEKPSSFKQKLQSLSEGDSIYISQLIGDFTLPPAPRESHSVLIAGGIGVTPFRSIIQHAKDTGESLNATLFYCSNQPSELAFETLFEDDKLSDFYYVPVVTSDSIFNWTGEQGFIDRDMIKRHVTNPLEAHYYLSGPPGMVRAYSDILKKMGVSSSHIETDFFPGYDN